MPCYTVLSFGMLCQKRPGYAVVNKAMICCIFTFIKTLLCYALLCFTELHWASLSQVVLHCALLIFACVLSLCDWWESNPRSWSDLLLSSCSCGCPRYFRASYFRMGFISVRWRYRSPHPLTCFQSHQKKLCCAILILAPLL